MLANTKHRSLAGHAGHGGHVGHSEHASRVRETKEIKTDSLPAPATTPLTGVASARNRTSTWIARMCEISVSATTVEKASFYIGFWTVVAADRQQSNRTVQAHDRFCRQLQLYLIYSFLPRDCT